MYHHWFLFNVLLNWVASLFGCNGGGGVCGHCLLGKFQHIHTTFLDLEAWRNPSST
eukprot:m.16719 g.16719  ORF g.16719 m.16719 type:complete len:56 (-) comp4662_c0_seq1:1221-1388(-)